MSIWCKLGMHEWNSSGCKCKRTFCGKTRHQIEKTSDCEGRCVKCRELLDFHKWTVIRREDAEDGYYIVDNMVKIDMRCTVCGTIRTRNCYYQSPEPQETEPQEMPAPFVSDETGHFPDGSCDPSFYSGWY